MMQLAIQPLFADGWQTVIGLLIFIFWSALQWLGSRNEAKQQQQKPRRPRPPQPVEKAEGQMPPVRGDQPFGGDPFGDRPAGGQPRMGQPNRGEMPPLQPPRNQPPRKQEDALRSEVEEFLRRAQGKPPQQAPIRAEQPPKRPAPQRAEPHEQTRTLVSKEQRAASQGQSTRSRQTPSERRNLREEGVAEHVAKHLDTQDIAAHSNALGEQVGMADERLESHLQEKFDHELGQLKHRETPADAKSPADDFASELVAMLREPEGMRKLIIANEILRRPEW